MTVLGRAGATRRAAFVVKVSTVSAVLGAVIAPSALRARARMAQAGFLLTYGADLDDFGWPFHRATGQDPQRGTCR